MTKQTFEKKFTVEVLKLEKQSKPYDYLKKGEFKITDKRTGSWSTYYWGGSYLVVNEGNLDMEYLDYLMSRGMGGGMDFVDIVEEYLGSKYELM